jgi:signal transduction histidine kinase
LDSILEAGWRDFEGALSAAGARFESDLHVGNGLWQIAARRLPWTSHAGDSALMVMIANRTAYLERDRARSEALQFVTHELRTPLVSIQGFAEYLQRFPEQASQSTAAATIFREARRLVAMIDTYLSVLRLEAGAHVLRQETFSVPQILEEIKQVVRPLAQAGGIEIEWWIVSPSAMAYGDPALIGGALLNLLSNAIKYSPCGEVVEVCLTERSGELELEVWNTGTLVSEEHLQRLFEPFYRIPGQAESKPGWGLGLAFVKRIAERHGGRVAVRTQKQRICFSLILPGLSVGEEVQL